MVSETLQGLAVDKDLEDWLMVTLLPVVYWHQHLHLTQNSRVREHYRKAWTQTSHALQAHPFSATLPDGDIQRWLTWAQWMVRHNTGVHRPLKDVMAVWHNSTTMVVD